MKKSLLALAALGAFASAAQAQSSVTLYGVIDTGLNYVNKAQEFKGFDSNGNPVFEKGRQINLSSGVLQGSRWGLRGAEDLGNGLKAVFTLESGFDVNNGGLQNGFSFFNRQAFAGLSGDFGTVTIGRQYDSISDFVSPLTASSRWEGTFAAHPGDVDNFNGTQRLSNSIKYTSTNYDGITFGGAYSVGGTPGKNSDKQVWSAGVGYANGPLALGAGYLNAKDPARSFYRESINESNPIFGSFINARSLEIIGAAGTYAFGPLTAGLTYSNTKFKDVNVSKYRGNAAFDNAEVSVAYQFSPALIGSLSYDYTRGNKIAGVTKGDDKAAARYHQINLGADYLLSPRTDVYVLGAYQKAKGQDSTGNKATAAIGGLAPSTDNTQGLVRVGLRHRF